MYAEVIEGCFVMPRSTRVAVNKKIMQGIIIRRYWGYYPMATYRCRSCKSLMAHKQVPQICDRCMGKGGSGADPDLDSRTDHEYGDFYPEIDDEY